jgi:hypothetical protein
VHLGRSQQPVRGREELARVEAAPYDLRRVHQVLDAAAQRCGSGSAEAHESQRAPLNNSLASRRKSVSLMRPFKNLRNHGRVLDAAAQRCDSGTMEEFTGHGIALFDEGLPAQRCKSYCAGAFEPWNCTP